MPKSPKRIHLTLRKGWRLTNRSKASIPKTKIPQSQCHSSYTMLGHCSEKTLAPASQQQWQQVFQSAGLQLNALETGYCGMAGIYGYEVEHLETSKSNQYLPTDLKASSYYLATDFSCRAQVQRFAGWLPLHPIQALQQKLTQKMEC